MHSYGAVLHKTLSLSEINLIGFSTVRMASRNIIRGEIVVG